MFMLFRNFTHTVTASINFIHLGAWPKLRLREELGNLPHNLVAQEGA